MENKDKQYIACKDCANCVFDGKQYCCTAIDEPIDTMLYYRKSYCGDSSQKQIEECKTGRYVVEGKLHKGEKRIFVETELDINNNPIGTWLDEVVENIPEGAKIHIVVDFED